MVNICTGDIGTGTRKYDLEHGFLELVNTRKCHINCTDYQANRLQIKYGQPGHANQPIVHTLNSTAVATSRALVAIIEQNQLSDGRVTIPDALVPYMGGQTILEPCNWG